MVEYPDPAMRYPDIAARGSLGAALQAVVDQGGRSVPVTASTSYPMDTATVASMLSHRNALRVNAWGVRGWSVRGEESFQGMALIEGDTEDLTELARAAQAWHDGTALSEIRRAAPFVHLTGRFEVPDNDPARLAESEWQHLRTAASEQDWFEYRALIEAAYAEPRLRALYPVTSHETLHFSITTRPCLTWVGPCVRPFADRYTVSTDIFGEDALAQATTAQDAVSAAVRHLPSDLGPVTSGAQ